ncbi:HAD-superfamily hydrolase subfamily IA, variant 3 [Candidatus Koribacter versatilis Ellin345]|uniref:HAD-superfamily hydrolase subfamily IA, variant 3 n=1 Tax=Koribacter versatilis (strain Ellin345) TaxID=204669 RepID=Q1IT01_KORVE|nr:HAD family phosphatase [Candidatus Koribacter versatilis]ABF39999.1 HAD-superfamily hydrolase subfamily IA, variant 3 [Candidatus Koribacter versatilis Ellin345]
MLDAVIFDCDGVLIDSEVVACRIAAEELTKIGYTISTEDVIRRFIGRTAREMEAEIENEWRQPIPDSFRKAVRERRAEAYATSLTAVSGVVEAVNSLTMPICVASSSSPETLRVGLSAIGLYERFAPNVVSAKMVARGKPEPDVFILAAGWMKASPLNCLVVEDSVPGVRAALRAGMRVLGFFGGSHCSPGHAEALLNAGAFHAFDDMRELPELIAKHE